MEQDWKEKQSELNAINYNEFAKYNAMKISGRVIKMQSKAYIRIRPSLPDTVLGSVKLLNMPNVSWPENAAITMWSLALVQQTVSEYNKKQ